MRAHRQPRDLSASLPFTKPFVRVTTVPTCPSRSDPYSLMPAAPHDAGAPHSSPGRGRVLLGQPIPQDPPNGHAPDPGEGIGVRPAAANAIPILEPCSERSPIASTCLIPLAPSKPPPLFNRENPLLVQRRRLGSVVQRGEEGSLAGRAVPPSRGAPPREGPQASLLELIGRPGMS